MMVFHGFTSRGFGMMKSVLVSLVIGMSILAFCTPTASAPGPQKLCIVIDPGHGGRANGSIGRNGLKEKDVVLDIAERLKVLLETTLNARVVRTRRGDYTVSLEERANIANRAKDGMPADLLISIHANACMGPAVNGFEVFYASKRHEFDLDEIIQMGGASVDEGDFRTRERKIAERARWDSLYRKHGEANKILASSVTAELENGLPMLKLVAAPAVLRLLRGLDMPAVLVEIGFLSNAAGETMLGTEGFRGTCAQALLKGVISYRDEMRDRLTGFLGARRPAAPDRRLD